MTKLASSLLTLALLLPRTAIGAEKLEAVPAGTKIGTIFVDLSDVSEGMDALGAAAHSGIADLVVSHLSSLGFEVVAYTGARPKEAVYTLGISALWRFGPNRVPYLHRVDASVAERNRVIGTVRYVAAAPEAGGTRGGLNAVKPLLTDLLGNVTRSRSAFPPDGGLEVPPPHPSAMLTPFTGFRANAVTRVLSGTKFPVPAKDLVAKLGGDEGTYLISAETWKAPGRTYGTIEYALSDMRSSRGYFYVQCVVDGKPRTDGTDTVLQAFLMFNFHESRFVYTEQPVFRFRPRSKAPEEPGRAKPSDQRPRADSGGAPD